MQDGIKSSGSALSDEDLSTMADCAKELILRIGEDPERDGLKDTPMRFAKAFRDLTAGYRMDIDEVVNGALFDVAQPNMVIVKDISFSSLCEHHLLPFYGTIDIGYTPRSNGKVLGLSKFARIAKMFSTRLQVQEQLGNDIAECLQEVLNPEGLGVVIKASHMCMSMRGASLSGSETVTTSLRGSYLEDKEVRQEFLAMIRK